MRLRRLLLPPLLLVVVTACGDQESGQPTTDRTYYCGSYESVEPGTVVSEPPC